MNDTYTCTIAAFVGLTTACVSAPRTPPVPLAAGTDREAVVLVGGSAHFMGAQLRGDSLVFEVPRTLLEQDFLVYQENRRQQQVLRWQRRGDRLLLIRPEVTLMTTSAAPRSTVSRHGQLPPLLAIFPIIAEHDDGSMVVNVTRLFTAEVSGFVGAAAGTDDARSFVEHVAVYSGNVEIDAVHTSAEPHPETRAPATTRQHWSFARLPADLMMPRLYDPRIGFWMESYFDEPRADYNAARGGSIVRWRLEKQDTSRAISDPVRPIVFYIDPETPARWRPWVRRGVETWQAAFEAAGFSNAIVAIDPPDDPDWSADDIRHSVVRWYARRQRDTPGGTGTATTVVDPRTGEILKANVYIGENYDVGRDWYFTMAAAVDPRAHQLPFPDSLMGAVYQALVSHEVGHALGVRDGSYGKLAYPLDSLRSEPFLRRMGFTPSIFNYTRFNTVAQPADSIPVELLTRTIGPADIYTIRWGYTPIPHARTPEDEVPVLESWAQEQDSMPWLRFVEGHYDEELYTTYDASDDANPVRAAELGLKNLQRVVEILPRATLTPGSDNVLLRHLYSATVNQWLFTMRRLVAVIGGVSVQYKSGSQPGPVFTPLPASEQRAAMRLLGEAALQTPTWLFVPEITHRFQPRSMHHVMTNQQRLLGQLLEFSRLERMAENEYIGGDVYTRAELLTDLRRSLWSELTEARVIIDDPFRRELQHVHIGLLAHQLRELRTRAHTAYDVQYRQKSGPTSYHLFRAEADALQSDIRRALPRVKDDITRGHLLNMLDVVATGLGTPSS